MGREWFELEVEVLCYSNRSVRRQRVQAGCSFNFIQSVSKCVIHIILTVQNQFFFYRRERRDFTHITVMLVLRCLWFYFDLIKTDKLPVNQNWLIVFKHRRPFLLSFRRYHYLCSSREFCSTELEMCSGHKHACLLYQQYLSNEHRQLPPSSAFANQLVP